MTAAQPPSVVTATRAPAGVPERDTTLNIHQRMLAVMADIGWLEKTAENEHFHYAFVPVEAIKDAVRTAHVLHGVMMHTTIGESSFEVVSGTEGKRTIVASCRGALTFVNVDQPDDAVVEEWAGMGFDVSDKALAKAITSGIKSALLNAYNIPTGRDPDLEGDTLPQGAQRAPQGGGRPQGGTSNAHAQRQAPQAAYDADGVPFPDDGARPANGNDKCPKHDRAWKSGQYGWYCSARDDSEEKGYCKQRPSKEWAAAHER